MLALRNGLNCLLSSCAAAVLYPDGYCSITASLASGIFWLVYFIALQLRVYHCVPAMTVSYVRERCAPQSPQSGSCLKCCLSHLLCVLGEGSGAAGERGIRAACWVGYVGESKLFRGAVR